MAIVTIQRVAITTCREIVSWCIVSYHNVLYGCDLSLILCTTVFTQYELHCTLYSVQCTGYPCTVIDYVISGWPVQCTYTRLGEHDHFISWTDKGKRRLVCFLRYVKNSITIFHIAGKGFRTMQIKYLIKASLQSSGFDIIQVIPYVIIIQVYSLFIV